MLSIRKIMLLKMFFAVLFLATIELSSSLIVRRNVDPDQYLEQYGYLATPVPGSNVQHSQAARRKAIKDFQKMASLPQTGQIDKVTLEKMKAPRCGMADRNSTTPNPMAPSSYKTYNKWDKATLTWKILNFTPDMPERDQRLAFSLAFEYWTEVTNLEFIQVSAESPADFSLSFGRYHHGCGYPFDGPGGTLAHCFYPDSGRADFDEDETWTENKHDGVNLRIVATHELGHGLGLSHSNVAESLMAPFYQGYTSHDEFNLHQDDIMAIQSLYGVKGGIVPRTTPKPTEIPTIPPGTGPCEGEHDAIVTTPDGYTYVFDWYYVYITSPDGDTRKEDWRNVVFPEPSERPPVAAAAYNPRNGRMYLFMGTFIYRYEYKSEENKFYLEEGYPLDNSHRLDYPKNPTAAVVIPSGWTNIFEDGKVWFYDEYSQGNADYRMDTFYKGGPDHVDSATLRGDNVFLFVGRYYYTRYGNDNEVHGPFLKDKKWMGC